MRKRCGSTRRTDGLLVLGLLAAVGLQAADYRHPIVFGRAHNDDAGTAVLKSKIWIMEDDGAGLRQLTGGITYDDHPSMYADLRHVLYSEFPVNELSVPSGARLIKLDIYSGQREVVAAVKGCSLHHASLSPFGDLLAYHRDCGKLRSQWVGWGEGSYEVNMVASNGVAVPDGIIFMHEKNLGAGNVRDVSIVRLYGHGAGSKAIFLTGDKKLHRRPAISPDGKLLAWQTDMATEEDEIFLANVDGSHARNLTNAAGNDGHPWFSRDGRTLVFESDRTGTWEIWKVELGTKKFTQLTFGGKKYESTRPRM